MTTTVYSASATVTEGAKGVITPKWKNNKTNGGKLRVVCRYGGSIVSQRYVGGDTRIVAVPPSAETSFASLVSHLAVKLGMSHDFKVKYQLPDQEFLDSLISVETDEDVQIMMEEHGYLTCEPSSVPKTRVRLFLFPSKGSEGGAGGSQGGLAQCKAAADVDWLGVGESKPEVAKAAVLQHPKTETWFVDALKGAKMMQAGRNNSGGGGSGDGNGGICGQEMVETNSAFGSSSSSVSSSNLPPVKGSGEDNTLTSQVKFVPVESVTRYYIFLLSLSVLRLLCCLGNAICLTGPEHIPRIDNTAVTQISSHELPTRPHVLELSKPVPVPVPGYPPFINQAHQQQHTHVVYTGHPPHITGTSPMTLPPPHITGTSPMTLPPTTYHHTNHVHYQPMPQPYPIYYSPVDQYNSRHVQAPHVKQHGTVLNTHQVDSTMVPLAPQLSPHVYPPPKPVDSLVQTSNEAAVRDDLIYNVDLDDDTACAQIYKTQPPGPITPSQLQTMMLTEALVNVILVSRTSLL
ncbi:hypothetical protein Bca4012_016561 [Brassica carinata]